MIILSATKLLRDRASLLTASDPFLGCMYLSYVQVYYMTSTQARVQFRLGFALIEVLLYIRWCWGLHHSKLEFLKGE